MWPLFIFSLVLWAVVFERAWYLWDIMAKCREIQEKILPLLFKKQYDPVNDLCKNGKLPIEKITSFAISKRNIKGIENRIDTYRKEIVQDLKKPLWILGTIGATAPFIGLFGTVVGIIRSFHNMSITGTGGFSVVSAGISEALIATAAGIVVAVIGVVFYNYYGVRVNRISSYLQGYSEELAEAIKEEE